ncbi:MAG: SCO family protein [Betaproteobacteria bacterium]|nr:MAG: SCO family protein [Betaproteobacteria bacterium]
MTAVLGSLVRRLAIVLAFAVGSATAQAQGISESAYALNLGFVDDHGATRALAEWRGHPVVMTLAYGACRSVCSSTLRSLEELQAAADRKGIAIDVVVVSIDPQSDTPQAWAQFRKSRRLTRANWTFLSGSAESTRTMARFLGVRFWSYDEHVMPDFKSVRLAPDGGIAASLDWQQREVDRLL